MDVLLRPRAYRPVIHIKTAKSLTSWAIAIPMHIAKMVIDLGLTRLKDFILFGLAVLILGKFFGPRLVELLVATVLFIISLAQMPKRFREVKERFKETSDA